MKKPEAKKLIANSNLIDKKGILQKKNVYLFIIQKTDNKTYYQRNREKILNKSKDCYKNDNERLREHARKNIETYLKKIKLKKREYGKNRYHNMSEEYKNDASHKYKNLSEEDKNKKKRIQKKQISKYV